MWIHLLFFCLTAVAPPTNIDADETSPRPSFAIAMSDWLLTIQARKLLWQDRELSRLNLAIVIEHGVGSLYGPVPSRYFQERAEAVVMQIPGLVFVHNRLRVQDGGRVIGPKVRQFPAVEQGRLPGRE